VALVVYKRWASMALLSLLALGTAATPALGAGKAASKPREQKISLLYVLSAKGATLVPKSATSNRYRLTVKRPQHDVVWFSDRPARKSGAFPLASFAGHWAGFGFDSDPPNVAVDYLDSHGRNRTALVELTDPRLSKGKLSFAARLLKPTAVTDRNLASHADAADTTPPRRMRDVALFVDDTTARVVDGCVLQPFTDCPGMLVGEPELDGADLSGAELSGSNIYGEIENVDFSNANLTNSSLGGFYENDDFEGADLETTYLDESIFAHVNMIGVNFLDAFVDKATFGNSNLREAQRFELLQGVIFCETTMPDGSFNNAGC
jgi:Pentapeptide repeats (8 copies)